MLGEQWMSRALRGVVPLQGLRRTHFISPAEASAAGEESLSVKWGASWAARPKQRDRRRVREKSYTNARDCMHWHVPVVIQGKRPIGAYYDTAHQTNTRPDNISLLFPIACQLQLVFHFLEGSADIHLVINPRTRGTFLALAMIYQIVSKTGSQTTVCITCSLTPFPLPEAHLQVVVSPKSGGTPVLFLCY